MSKFIDIDKENGELIMQHMETALAFQGWSLLCAKYDGRLKSIRAFYSCEKDTDLYIFSFKMNETGKLIVYTKRHFSVEMFPEIFIKCFDTQTSGFVFTVHEERLKRVFERVMTPELALKMIDAGIRIEKAARGVK